ncbi:MAG TPA: HEAT repeat domain-containing protein [Chloroflexia bacterium]|nr:HEAT repeat domain-containing protein [Chloroflexia bacterium]
MSILQDNVLELFNDAERYGQEVLENLLSNEHLEVKAGVYTDIIDEHGRPNRLNDLIGTPQWSDIVVRDTRSSPAYNLILNLNYPQYHQKWYTLASEVQKRQERGEQAATTELIELLALSVLVRQDIPATVLIETLATRREAAVEQLLPLLGRGNARLRSAVARTLAATKVEKALLALLEYLPQEPAEGVRGDIIISLISVQDPFFLSRETFYGWLGSPDRSDALTTLLTFTRFSPILPPEFQQYIHPDHQEYLAPWFA